MVSKEELHDFYIIKNHSYDEVKDKYGLSGYRLDKLLKEYDIKKSRKQSAKKVLETKYKKAGSKEAYNTHMRNKSIETWISNYGSFENYISHLSNQTGDTWRNKSTEELKQHAQTSLKNGGCWNYETAQKTLMDKYGVTNAYALAKYTNNSAPNKLLQQRLLDNNLHPISEFVLIADGKYYKYDFAIGKNLIELNPWPFHNTTFTPIKDVQPKDKKYHYDKSCHATENGYRCIHIWDWDDIDKITSVITPREKIYARKCVTKEVTRAEAKEYLSKHHLQGYSRDSIRIGLYHNDELVSIMTFGKPRYNKNYQWELIRYCSNKLIVGGDKKLFSHFINGFSPTSIISYCDNSKFTGRTYERLGFTQKSKGTPARHWYNPVTGAHITDNLLRQRGFDQLLGKEYGEFGKGTSNEELMINHGFVEIYDCGQSTYVWVND